MISLKWSCHSLSIATGLRTVTIKLFEVCSKNLEIFHLLSWKHNNMDCVTLVV